METGGVPEAERCTVAKKLLEQKLTELAGKSAAFENAEQVSSVLRLVFDEVLPAYRRHHRDLLFHPVRCGFVAAVFRGASGGGGVSRRRAVE